eukprot:jgi/Mesen1/684/ME000109S_10904
MSNTFGHAFRVTTFGESHGGGVGCVIDGCPPRVPISEGGGRSSARETIGRVAAGAVAKKILAMYSNTDVLAYVSRVHNVDLPESSVDFQTLSMDQVEANIVRCPDPEAAVKMIEAIDKVRVRGDSCGGVVTCIARNVPKRVLRGGEAAGLGAGAGAEMVGSEHNDEFYIDEEGQVRTRTNRSGGIQGGISNGETIIMRIAFKPTSTITLNQKTVTRDRQETELRARGRHDPCVVPRAVPMVEAMVALVLVDQLMQHHAQCNLLPPDDSFLFKALEKKAAAPSMAEQAALYSEH